MTTVPHDATAVQSFDCEQTVRRLWDYLDGELSTADFAAVDAHLAHCDRCPPHFAFERRFLQAVRDARANIATLDRVGLAQLRARVIDTLDAAGERQSSGSV